MTKSIKTKMLSNQILRYKYFWAAREYPSLLHQALNFFFTRRDGVEGADIPSKLNEEWTDYTNYYGWCMYVYIKRLSRPFYRSLSLQKVVFITSKRFSYQLHLVNII